MAYAALRLSERRRLCELDRWVHMLGFRGDFVTKSRLYFTTLGELRDVLLATSVDAPLRAAHEALLDDLRRGP
jgi:hypothetical protein